MGKKLKKRYTKRINILAIFFLGVFILLMIRRYLLSKNFNFDIINFYFGSFSSFINAVTIAGLFLMIAVGMEMIFYFLSERKNKF